MKRQLFVLAGTYPQYVNYVRERGIKPRDAIYLSRPEVLRGRKIHGRDQVARVGTFRERRDWPQMEEGIALALGRTQ